MMSSQTVTGRQSRRGVPLAILAAVLGLPYIVVNLYWAFGGDGLLSRYGSHLIGKAVPGDTQFEVASAVLALLMLVAVVSGLVATTVDFDSPGRPPARWIAWLSAGWLGIYGGIMTIVGLTVGLGLRDTTNGNRPAVYRWHALFWDPWMLVWGIVLAAALLVSARAYLATGRELK